MSRNRNAALLPPLLRNVTPFAVQNRVYRLNKRNQLTKRTERVSMHSLDANAMHSFAGDASQGLIEPCFRYTPEQVANSGEQPYVSDVVLSKVERREFFYGIEITAQSNGKLTCVDFNSFLPILPSFISIVWLPHYWNVTPLERVETLQMIRHLEPYIPAMPHFSVYKQTKKRINEFLSLNFKNLLAVRGDKRDDNQFYLYGYQLIEHARRVRKEHISIAVPGYPQGHVSLDKGKIDMDQNIAFLKMKVDKGADFIITQMCYSAELIIKYVQAARDAGIVTPIMVGVVVPESLEAYKLMEKITKIKLPAEKLAKLEKIEKDDVKVRKFFVHLALSTILKVLDAKLDVYGIQFYTMNRFGAVHDVLRKLRKRGILKETPPDACEDA
ncbi:PREDICTED: methylenetetrahydrofolate reductase [Drosophila arizonae]|uniref:Methylenetetrahydrofolate reductase n=1 Tax=Drosophila arizonae TaxID=7263 RepID=A0ABM1PB03_DROAR|nr:PREDICTED: methylenetetrahydrofolate reductase [Drosophila arizonae]